MILFVCKHLWLWLVHNPRSVFLMLWTSAGEQTWPTEDELAAAAAANAGAKKMRKRNLPAGTSEYQAAWILDDDDDDSDSGASEDSEGTHGRRSGLPVNASEQLSGHILCCFFELMLSD